MSLFIAASIISAGMSRHTQAPPPPTPLQWELAPHNASTVAPLLHGAPEDDWTDDWTEGSSRRREQAVVVNVHGWDSCYYFNRAAAALKQTALQQRVVRHIDRERYRRWLSGSKVSMPALQGSTAQVFTSSPIVWLSGAEERFIGGYQQLAEWLEMQSSS
eukprot:TRINITY_DN2895_c0_g1_i2.p1 TRINITY_DN2895_c0_g1~~TRINITY_DN2895_c0_g1_i2.p1  ORF type:complete len:160 (-),score=14.43 TRINITY_DN2895_c0_g1_i2:164-643(-)